MVVLFVAGDDVENVTQQDARLRSGVEINLAAAGIGNANPHRRRKRIVDVLGAGVFVLRILRGTTAAAHVTKLERVDAALAGSVSRRSGQHRGAVVGVGTGDDATGRVLQYQ